MHRYRRNLLTLSALMMGMSIISAPSYAAKPVDLSHQSVSMLQSLMSGAAGQTLALSETRRLVGPNHTLHVRVQQTYAGHPIWGADAVVHIPNGVKTGKAMSSLLKTAKANHATMNGIFYQGLAADLAKTPAQALSEEQAQKALRVALDTFRHEKGENVPVHDEKTQLMVYVDKAEKAHWVYQVSFFMDQQKEGTLPENPIYMMDAKTFEVYLKWDNIHTAKEKALDAATTLVDAGGLGGNGTTGQLSYDGAPGHLPAFQITRNASTNTCYLTNPDVRVKRVRVNEIVSIPCAAVDPEHNNVYWTGGLDGARGGFSTINDGMYAAQVMNTLFNTWYHMPMIAKDGQPMQMAMIFHFKMDNAIYANGVLSMGDGVTGYFYPFTSRDIVAHEMAHGLVEQYSHLSYVGDSGALDEAFGDMTAKAAEYFVTGTTTWTYGADVVTAKGGAIRYLDTPSKDCGARTPGDNCSIDEMSQYQPGLYNHFKAGVFNRLFYLMSTTPGWNTKAAYDVMLGANMHYWTQNTTFQSAACGIISSAKDLHYDVSAINNALMTVGINYANC